MFVYSYLQLNLRFNKHNYIINLFSSVRFPSCLITLKFSCSEYYEPRGVVNSRIPELNFNELRASYMATLPPPPITRVDWGNVRVERCIANIYNRTHRVFRIKLDICETLVY